MRGNLCKSYQTLIIKIINFTICSFICMIRPNFKNIEDVLSSFFKQQKPFLVAISKKKNMCLRTVQKM